MTQKYVLWWLYSILTIVIGMVVLGGVTRLSGSGLSIVEWNVVQGILPPWTAEQWAQEFTKYQQSPEFQHVNFMFSLEDFKNIFWMEYIHRLVGRLGGMLFFLPGVVFWRKQWLTSSLKRMYVQGGFLWIAQGVMGWYMVKSGLHKDSAVNPLRLGLHLALAFFLASYVYVQILAYKNTPIMPNSQLTALLKGNLILLSLTIFYGAQVAGHKAGLIYNTFPLMGNRWMPEELTSLYPIWQNFLDNPVMIQFIHRVLAISTFLILIGTSAYGLRHKAAQTTSCFYTLIFMALLQLGLGIITLVYAVPLVLGVFHQLGALLVLLSLITCCYKTGTRFI